MTIPYLITRISLAATEALVANGYGFGPSATITDATNSQPIVITTDAPLGIPEGTYIHVVVSGVVGNAAANGTYIAQVLANDISGSTLSLFDSLPDGPTPVAGTGSYTSGGLMRSAFSDGKVLLGPQWLMAQSAPPRVVFVPTSSGFGQSPTPSSNFAPNSATYSAGITVPWTWTDTRRFRVEVWGARYLDGALASDPDEDWVYLEYLRNAIIQAMSQLLMGAFRMSDGKWSESDPRNANLDISGRRFEFNVDMYIPVLLQPNPIQLVPAASTGTSTVYPQPESATGPDAITILAPT